MFTLFSTQTVNVSYAVHGIETNFEIEVDKTTMYFNFTTKQVILVN